MDSKSVSYDSIPIPLLQALLIQTDIHSSLEILARYVDNHVPGHAHGIILLYDAEKNCLHQGSRPHLRFTPTDSDRDNILPIKADGTTSSRAAFFREPVLTLNADLDPGWDEYRDMARQLNVKAVYSFPILSSKNDLLGIFAIFYENHLEKEPAETNIFRALTGLASIVLERYQTEIQTSSILTELSASKERLSLAIQAQKMGVWDWHVQSNKLLWDDNMYDLFGLPKAESTGTLEDWTRFVLPDDLEITYSILDKVFRENIPFDHQFRISKNGEVRHIAAVGSLMRDARGQAYRMTGLNWDITEKVLASRKIENEKAKSVAASKMASLGEMASGVAHEINNPLTIILNRANQLKSRLVDDKLEKSWALQELGKIESTVERIAKIIRGLRAFSRNADNDPMISCELNAIIDESLELCRERLKKHGIELRLISLANAVPLKCRPSQISQVLLNILNNAFDAIVESASPWIEMSTVQKGSEVHIRITDSGTGIPVAIADKMMDPFFTTKEVGKGTGLGLPIAKGIVEEHGGKLHLDRDSIYTSFLIELPLQKNP